MKNTNKLLGIIALVAIIGFSFPACGNDGGGAGGGADSTLNGRWVPRDPMSNPFIFNNGNYEMPHKEGDNNVKGTYTISGNTLIITPTHLWGGNSSALEERWYTIAELIEAGFLFEAFAPETVTYSLRGNTLTVTYHGESETFTRSGS